LSLLSRQNNVQRSVNISLMIIDAFLPYTHTIKKYYINSIKLLTGTNR